MKKQLGVAHFSRLQLEKIITIITIAQLMISVTG